MAKKLPFEDESFDIIFHPVSKNLRITHIHRAIQKIEYNLAYRVIRSFFVYSFTGA